MQADLWSTFRAAESSLHAVFGPIENAKRPPIILRQLFWVNVVQLVSLPSYVPTSRDIFRRGGRESFPELEKAKK